VEPQKFKNPWISFMAMPLCLCMCPLLTSLFRALMIMFLSFIILNIIDASTDYYIWATQITLINKYATVTIIIWLMQYTRGCNSFCLKHSAFSEDASLAVSCFAFSSNYLSHNSSHAVNFSAFFLVQTVGLFVLLLLNCSNVLCDAVFRTDFTSKASIVFLWHIFMAYFIVWSFTWLLSALRRPHCMPDLQWDHSKNNHRRWWVELEADFRL